ncbi:methyltransferase domain-containing protein [Bisporella sp. PMI_857]|nr:methyltransferase domain-containing protein [Bisporella sp. PMI_857]
MPPAKPLPCSDEFAGAEEYVDELLRFSATSGTFQTLCGGVHILDFFTGDRSLYHNVIPAEWREWLLARDSMELLDFLMRDELVTGGRWGDAPESLTAYVKVIRRLSLRREVVGGKGGDRKLPRHVAVGMIPKKVHEVSNFAEYVVRVADFVSGGERAGDDGEVEGPGGGITHFVDFGSGQNYLGRTLASPPYNKSIVAVESKESNIKGARGMDVSAGIAEREVVRRNKKVWRMMQEREGKEENSKARRARKGLEKMDRKEEIDLRPTRELGTVYTPTDGKGYVQYVEHRVLDGNLADVVEQVERLRISMSNGESAPGTEINGESDKGTETNGDGAGAQTPPEETRLMAISIHSCGNLSHHGIRSLILNPAVKAIAIVGCCYNLMTERLAPSYKLPHLRPNMRAINAPRLEKESSACDPHGFPMSKRVEAYDGRGIGLNITARMMAVQAPGNWTEKESEAFFTRHFYRALLQRVFLDRDVVRLMKDDDAKKESTEAVIIGSLRKGCYETFVTYVRGALEKIGREDRSGKTVLERMGDISDKEIEEYSKRYEDLKKELSITWSLMAFSAGVVESLIVVDRWLYLREHGELVQDAWVEAVFDYHQSPRNLVVVGIKR